MLEVTVLVPVRVEKVESLVCHHLRLLHNVDIVHYNFWCYRPALQDSLHRSFSEVSFYLLSTFLFQLTRSCSCSQGHTDSQSLHGHIEHFIRRETILGSCNVHLIQYIYIYNLYKYMECLFSWHIKCSIPLEQLSSVLTLWVETKEQLDVDFFSISSRLIISSKILPGAD